MSNVDLVGQAIRCRLSKVLRQRVITALVLIAVLVWAVFFWPNSYFAMLVLLVCFVAAHEWMTLQKMRGWLALVLALGLTAISACVVFLVEQSALLYLSWCVLVLWLGLIVWLIWTNRYQLPTQPLAWEGFLALPLLVLVSALLVALHANGAWLLLYVLAIAWAADIGAYFAGRRFGQRKLAPTISPGKSIEGFVGGMVCVLLLAVVSLFVFDVAADNPFTWILASLVAAVLSVAGDLFESTMKRAAQVKDSGWVLPGHGGVLDRIDSLLASVPAFVAVASVVIS